MRRLGYSIFAVLFVFSIPSCSKNEVPKGEPMDFNKAAGPIAKNAAGPNLQVPDGWVEEQPASPLRKAQFRLPASVANEEDAQVAVFTGIGGSVQQNVDRWIKQFKNKDGSPAADSAHVETKEISGYKVTLVDVSGTFEAGGMGPMARGNGPKEGYRMLAAVIETSSAPWFIKLTGPESTVEKWKTSFDQYVASIGNQ